MDANFGLVHKHHSGVSTLPPDVKNSYFVGSDEVQSFITEYQTDNEKDKVCTFFNHVVIKF